ncbi:phage tail tape measure protein [Bifidobacterium imperatoris]|uniref:Phage tail tape measure protein n=1 Tax=Bifidobacterium imperatoris TaxID=2020965 RepID=A0ABX7S3J8_9BIFI|nr:phage tail tape measure protein [Bifidobacterium imperatoris]
MSTVQANTGASAAELDKLRQAAIDAGANTVYNAQEAADAINELGKAGMSTTDILSGGLSGALNLAASDGMQVSEAAELMSSAMAQFNLTGKQAGNVADALAAGAGKAQGSARDLGYALQQSGMVANSFGIGMTETVGTLTAFANAGMIGSGRWHQSEDHAHFAGESKHQGEEPDAGARHQRVRRARQLHRLGQSRRPIAGQDGRAHAGAAATRRWPPSSAPMPSAQPTCSTTRARRASTSGRRRSRTPVSRRSRPRPRTITSKATWRT